MRILDRSDAGRQLAVALSHLREEHPVVVGLPRGGVVVAAEVARHLDAPLDVILVRKLGFPFQPELAMGAIGEGGVQVNRSEKAGVGSSSLPPTTLEIPLEIEVSFSLRPQTSNV